MSTRVSKSQFKARALEYLRQVEETGEPLIVTHRGRPTVEVRRYASPAREPLARLRGSVLWLERPTDSVGDDEWEVMR
jgi:prevent-host-death family protein